MNFFDWLIVLGYMAGVVLMSFFIGRRQNDQDDYYLGGRRLAPWQVGLSMVANQVSAISLIGAPAFIAMKEGGGLIWLQYEMAIPLSMAAIILFILPYIRRGGAVTIYSFLEGRFGAATRQVVSLVFLLSRSMATGVALLATSYVASSCTGWPLAETILIIGAVSLIYTMMGGIRADIYSDILQLFILWTASLAVIITIVSLLPAGSDLFSAVDAPRMKVFDFRSTGIGDGATFSFWPMVLGGFFLYVSYYGCDQSQAQRLLGTGDEKGAVRALVINGLVRYPLVLTYCIAGILMLPFIKAETGFGTLVSQLSPDALMPEFFVRYLPTGVLGLTVAGIFAASMSSIDSAINSLSAASWNDFLLPRMPRLGEIPARRQVLYSRLITVAWGILTIGFSLFMVGGSDTVIELVNKIGSAFYGPIAAVFLLGAFSRRMGQISVLTGFAGGFLLNIYLWLFHGSTVSWMWWNFTGLGGTCLVALLAHLLSGSVEGEVEKPGEWHFSHGRQIALLLAWFLFIVVSAAVLESWFAV